MTCHSHKRASALRWLSSLLGLALLLTGCGLGLASSRSRLDRWLAAVQRGDYAAAGQVMVPAHVAAWQTETETLHERHRGIQAYQRSDLVPVGGERPVVHITWTWNDGFVRCMRVQETPEQRIPLLDPGYRDCTDMPQPPAPDRPGAAPPTPEAPPGS